MPIEPMEKITYFTKEFLGCVDATFSHFTIVTKVNLPTTGSIIRGSFKTYGHMVLIKLNDIEVLKRQVFTDSDFFQSFPNCSAWLLVVGFPVQHFVIPV